eukprot:jgi/Mesen1/2203/ME000152S01298
MAALTNIVLPQAVFSSNLHKSCSSQLKSSSVQVARSNGTLVKGLSSRVQSRSQRFLLVRASDDVASRTAASSTASSTPKSIVSEKASQAQPATETNAASAAGDSIVAEVASLPEEGDTEGVASKRKPSPLQRGGTLSGAKAEGKDPGAAALGKAKAVEGEKFSDARWKEGTWDITQFTSDNKVNWDAVIDAEVSRRKWLEENPESSTNEDPVLFDTSIVPWWAWVRRFHLPEAEKLNGRAAMIGYAAGWVVDSVTGAGLVDQTNSFFGKLLIVATVVGVLLVRKTDDVVNIKNLADEATFYDKQWQATWKDSPPPSEKDESSK